MGFHCIPYSGKFLGVNQRAQNLYIYIYIYMYIPMKVCVMLCPSMPPVRHKTFCYDLPKFMLFKLIKGIIKQGTYYIHTREQTLNQYIIPAKLKASVCTYVLLTNLKRYQSCMYMYIYNHFFGVCIILILLKHNEI